MVSTRSFFTLGLLLAIGLGIFGYQISNAVRIGRGFDRYFTVRGLSERVVKATSAIWPIRVQVDDESLQSLQEKIKEAKNQLRDFLSANDLTDAEISFGIPRIRDRYEDSEFRRSKDLPRYEATLTLVVRSREVDKVKIAVQNSEQLISKGLPLLTNEYGEMINFTFDGINELKPQMIEEATANARIAAEKFAQDSRAKVGAIRKAMQGVVDISQRDVASPEMKVVRVVTTVEFFIE